MAHSWEQSQSFFCNMRQTVRSLYIIKCHLDFRYTHLADSSLSLSAVMKYGRVRKRQHVWMVFYSMHVGMHAHSSMANILISITISQRIWTGRTELEWAWKEMRRKKVVNAFRNAPWNQRRKQNSVVRTLISKLTGKSKEKIEVTIRHINEMHCHVWFW